VYSQSTIVAVQVLDDYIVSLDCCLKTTCSGLASMLLSLVCDKRTVSDLSY
jgi:hypothetical protein